jgi:acyl carrier protein
MKKRMTSARRHTRAAPAPPPSELRRDDAGQIWSPEQVVAEIAAIMCALDDNLTPKDVKRSATFSGDLGWDDWFKMRLRKPIENRLHESLSAFLIMERVKTVGDLIDYVWSSMEAA